MSSFICKGPKKGWNQGACGACTVLMDGERIERILSCLALAVQYDGRQVTAANAIHNATGKRVRDLPITLDNLLPKDPFQTLSFGKYASSSID